MDSSLSLWAIEESIMGLTEIIESPDASEDERAAAKNELERWILEEIGKVDRVRGFLKHCDMMEAAAKAEARAMSARAKLWADRASRLKQISLAVMEARGVKRLEGRGGVLRRQGNGGLQRLKIGNETIVPEEYYRYGLTMDFEDWIVVQAQLKIYPECLRRLLASVTKQINTDKIRHDLQSGIGVPGCELEDRAEHLRVE